MDANIMKSDEKDEVSEKFTVLQLVTGLNVGGAERVVMEMTGRLTTLGFRPIVVSLKDDIRLIDQYSNVDFQVHSIGMDKNLWSFIKATIALIRIIRSKRVSLIHAHMFHALSLALICKIAIPSCKLVFTSHSSKGFSILRRMVVVMTKTLRDADVIFVAEQHQEMNATKAFVIPNCVPMDTSKPSITKKARLRRVSLFVGRLELVKNPVALIRVFAEMRHKDCELWMAGEGYMRQEVERKAEELGISNRVRLLGLCQDVPQLLQKVDCLVMSSHWEGLPMAILEAGVVALPVVATPVGAIPKLLGGDCGYLADISELQNTLDAVLDDYTDACRRGKRLQEKIINGFTLDHMCRAHDNLYRTLITNT